MPWMPRNVRKRNSGVLAAKPEPKSFSKQECENIFAILNGEPHIAVAVSGGSDSMAMLRLAAVWADGKVKLTALTVNHGLRREASAEALQVEAWCADHSIDHCSLLWLGEKPKTGVQAKARTARYDLMAEWCDANGVRWLITGHTQDDQAETVLMRQRRTLTPASLAGIWKTSEWGGIKLLRPLLGYRRAELRRYLLQIGQRWVDDPSNVDDTFERVRARKALADNDDRTVGLAQIATDAGHAIRQLDGSAKNWLQRNLEIFPEGYGVVPRQEFSASNVDVQRRVVLKLIHLFGAGTAATPHELEVVSFWIGSDGRSRRTLGGAVIACRARHVLIGREAGRIPTQTAVVPESGKIVWDGRFEITASPQSRIVSAGRFEKLPRRKDLPAFVQSGLPAILLADGAIIVPHLGIGHGVGAKFIRYLR
jgi:tRNA(Ile)-lysidine synthase